MRYIKLFVISAGVLFLLVTAMSLLIPFQVRISRAVNIAAPVADIWQQVDDMRKWKDWNPFFSDTAAGKMHFDSSVDGKITAIHGEGFNIRWKDRVAGERIALLRLNGRKPIVSAWNCIRHPGSDSTTVQWYMDFNLRWYPWEKFSSLLFENSYGTNMERGLGNLKKLVEENRTSRN